MKAKLAPRITTENRTPLQDVIPLETPYLLFIDPSSLCNQECNFCPTGNRKMIRRYYEPGIMGLPMFDLIISQLKEFPDKVKTIRLYKDGEPLINPMLDIMIHMAKQVADSVDFTTNGLRLDELTVDRVISAGVDKIFLSVPVDYTEKYVDQIRYLAEHKGTCHVHAKIIDDGSLSIEDKDRFFQSFGNLVDSINIENLVSCWPQFFVHNATGKGIYQNEAAAEPVKVCPYLFYSMAINHDGSVSACFLDWKHREIIGDIKEAPLKKIWNGGPMIARRLTMLTERRHQISFCAVCNQLAFGMPDNIDQYAKDILRRL